MSYLQNNNSPLTIKSYHFAIKIVQLVKHKNCSAKEFGMMNQIFRSGTAIGALISESTYAQSPKDFISKLSIALKECNETIYWLNLLKDTGYLENDEFTSLEKDCKELLALLISSIKTTKQKIKEE